jgi:hypothetical protein
MFLSCFVNNNLGPMTGATTNVLMTLDLTALDRMTLGPTTRSIAGFITTLNIIDSGWSVVVLIVVILGVTFFIVTASVVMLNVAALQDADLTILKLSLPFPRIDFILLQKFFTLKIRFCKPLFAVIYNFTVSQNVFPCIFSFCYHDKLACFII